jgi:hypothetical protein
MPDRALSFGELRKLFTAHGCRFQFNEKTKFMTILRREGSTYRFWKQHAHKGKRDHFHRFVVGQARRRLGFADMSDDDFYRPLN